MPNCLLGFGDPFNQVKREWRPFAVRITQLGLVCKQNVFHRSGATSVRQTIEELSNLCWAAASCSVASGPLLEAASSVDLKQSTTQEGHREIRAVGSTKSIGSSWFMFFFFFLNGGWLLFWLES